MSNDNDHKLNMDADTFREIGHELIDSLANFIGTIDERKTAPDLIDLRKRPKPLPRSLPEKGSSLREILHKSQIDLFDGVRHINHPRTLGCITGTPAPAAILADFLATTLNANLVGWDASLIPCEIEDETVKWVAELLAYPSTSGGLFVSGGTVANFIGFLVARAALADWNIRQEGLSADGRQLRIYAASETHTWIEKAAEISGLGLNAIRWIGSDDQGRIDLNLLQEQLVADKTNGDFPFLIIGNAGNCNTGAVDPLNGLADLAEKHDVWFHVDGAFGAPACITKQAKPLFSGMERAHSLAVDAHKWLFAPLEAGLVLIRDRNALRKSFAFEPTYYHGRDPYDDEVNNYFAFGLQNSRNFRALKVWALLQNVGKNGFIEEIERNLTLAQYLIQILEKDEDFEVGPANLSLVTFRYTGGSNAKGLKDSDLNQINAKILVQIKNEGRIHLSNSVIDDVFYLKAISTNFRTQQSDMDLVPVVVREVAQKVLNS